MTVGLKLGCITDEVGRSDFFHSFFSTVSGNLEPEGWGTRFPVLLRSLYGGQLVQRDASTALFELQTVEKELSFLSAEKVIWNIEDRTRPPPWAEKISSDITDLSNYFVTSTGRSLISLLRECLEELKEAGGVLQVVNY